MPSLFETASASQAIPITFASKANWDAVKKALPAEQRQFAEANGFAAKPGKCLVLPAANGAIAQVIFGIEEEAAKSRDPFRTGELPGLLPAGTYRFANAPHDARLAALGFALGSYRFARYRKVDNGEVRLVPPDGVDAAELARMADGAFLARDLINTPSNDMGPAELEAAARGVAARFGATFSCIAGDELAKGFPLIHAVGMASTRSPRLIDFSWGDPSHPKVTLVGKGVCFDTGGLDLKPSSGMLLMKKDMGGAANALGLAQLVMALGLPVQLQLLIPAVENAIAGNAYRPGDVIKTRQGLHIEIGNTDAEGRVILCDAMAYGAEGQPALLIDLATLTGAARTALGPQLPALFTRDMAQARELVDLGLALHDPLWHLPLWRDYHGGIESDIADIVNTGRGAMAGAINAAIFLEDFVPEAIDWWHVDLYAWNDASRPGRPAGGEAQTVRTLLAQLERRYSRR